ncbi:MAG: hypothetical protein V9H69_20790 [Anaerolineae bacterium]
MRNKLRLIVLVAALAALTITPLRAQEGPTSPGVGVCAAGAGYASGCDVDQDGDIDIYDIQLTAGRWNSSGAYLSGHTHWGDTWTGAGPGDGLRVENTAASSYAYGVTGVSASTSGRGVYGYTSAASGATFGVQGQSASTAGRGVFGLVTATSGDTDGVLGEAASTLGRGVRGVATASSGPTTGVMGTAVSTEGRGVLGMASASTGAAYGVYGESASTAGRGVYGRATAASGQAFGVHGVSASDSGRGLFGHATSSSGSTYGVVGQTDSSTGAGVQGYASTPTGINYGVWGLSLSSAGTGVLGQATAASGTTFGVYGQSFSDQGYGVYGVTWANTGTTYGVYGRSLSTGGYAGFFTGRGADALFVENTGSGRGIQVSAATDTAIWAITDTGTAGVDGRASGPTGRGLYGRASSTTGVNYGVYGRTDSAAGYAGYFLGNLHTTGTLSKAAGSFKIDHPLDPANQYLYHSFVESPDMKNIYDGVATLDAEGAALVNLPDWFEALNRDFRYQLTPMGAAMPGLYIAQEIQGQRLSHRRRRAGHEGLLDGHRHPPGRLRGSPPHPGGGAQAGRGARPLPAPGGAGPAGGAGAGLSARSRSVEMKGGLPRRGTSAHAGHQSPSPGRRSVNSLAQRGPADGAAWTVRLLR